MDRYPPSFFCLPTTSGSLFSNLFHREPAYGPHRRSGRSMAKYKKSGMAPPFGRQRAVCFWTDSSFAGNPTCCPFSRSSGRSLYVVTEHAVSSVLVTLGIMWLMYEGLQAKRPSLMFSLVDGSPLSSKSHFFTLRHPVNKHRFSQRAHCIRELCPRHGRRRSIG